VKYVQLRYKAVFEIPLLEHQVKSSLY